MASVSLPPSHRPPLTASRVLGAVSHPQAFYPFPEKPDVTTRDLCVRLLAFAADGKDGDELKSTTAHTFQHVQLIAKVSSAGRSCHIDSWVLGSP